MTTLSVSRRSRRDKNTLDSLAQTTDRQTPVLPETSASAPKLPKKKRAVYYPTGDGKPMAEDVWHLALMHYTIPALMYRYRLRPDVLVAGNDFLYYEEGNPRARISPDCYIVFGVQPKPVRHFYKIWEENGITPTVVFEFTSKKTKKEDVTIKRPLYEQTLRIQEYFQFDPTGDYLHPRLQGQRLTNGVYQPIPLDNDRMTSEQLGLELVVKGETLRFYDPATSEFLPTYEQAETQRLEETQRAKHEAQRAERERQRAEAADQHAQEETLRAEREALRAESAEAELERMRQELDALRQQQ